MQMQKKAKMSFETLVVPLAQESGDSLLNSRDSLLVLLASSSLFSSRSIELILVFWVTVQMQFKVII